jgi:hypothetical protein
MRELYVYESSAGASAPGDEFFVVGLMIFEVQQDGAAFFIATGNSPNSIGARG